MGKEVKMLTFVSEPISQKFRVSDFFFLLGVVALSYQTSIPRVARKDMSVYLEVF